MRLARLGEVQPECLMEIFVRFVLHYSLVRADTGASQ
jgi:hypothetical protein